MVGNKKIGEILLELGFIRQEQLNAALLHQKKSDPKKKIGEILVELGFLNELDLLKCLAGLFRVRYIPSDKLLKMTIPQWILDLIPLEFAEKNKVLPFFCYDKTKILSVVISDPQDQQLLKLIKKVSGYYEVERYLALESTIKAGIAKYYKSDQATFDHLRNAIKASHPQAIASFIPKNEEVIDPQFTQLAEGALKPKEILAAIPPKVVPGQIEAAAPAEEPKRRLADQISSFSILSEDTFIEVLNIVINILETYKGENYQGHSARVANLVKEISRNLGLKAKETYRNVLAAYLHDCCMNAPEHLTLLHFKSDNNLNLLRKYSQSSERLFAEAHLPEEVQNILLHTFERYDGEGFPDGLQGEAIPLGSRIIATVDAFIHLINFGQIENFRHSYKNSFDYIKSLQDKYFDPETVDLLEEVILDLFIDETSPRVILIDSNPEELGLLATKLKKNGILPYPLKSTEKVIDILNNTPVSLIISDINTKPLDGFSVCNLIKTNEKYKEVNFLFLSEKNDSDTVSKGFEAGADDFITKPYNPDILIAKVQNFIKHATQKTEEKAKTIITHKKGITGNLAEIHVTDLIQMLFSGRKTGVLKLFKEEESGEVFFDHGQVINARYKEFEGVDAFNLLVRWEHGLFILDPDAELREQKIYESTEFLLIEACRVWDEESHHER